MRENIKALTMGIKVITVTLFVAFVIFSAMVRGTSTIGTAPADGTLADSWTHIDAPAWHPKGCWGDDEPALVKVPGHVYATFPNGEQEKRGAVWVKKALDQIFTDKDTKGLAPIAFCR